MSDNVQNPGSALGEAIGYHLEIALNEYIEQVAADYTCLLVSTGKLNRKTNKPTKLLLYDDFGIPYNIDAVITNSASQPLILIEYKYIRYKKHNRDKGSWICTAHSALRRSYNSVRSSIAILAGSWSMSSLAMLKSNDINVFLIPFKRICDLLAVHGIDFNWGEKDRDIALDSWARYSALSYQDKLAIAEEMIVGIKDQVERSIQNTLDETIEREVAGVVLEIHTNIGEVKIFKFETISDALDFLEDFTFEEIFDNANSFTLFNHPKTNTKFPKEDEEEET